MGDRGNIKLTDQKNPDVSIYLYAHWGGSELPKLLQDGLIRGKSRWHDTSYLNRSIICEAIRDDGKETTGFGISTFPGDNSRPVLEVDHDSSTVVLWSADGWHTGEWEKKRTKVNSWSFEAYCALKIDSEDCWRALCPS